MNSKNQQTGLLLLLAVIPAIMLIYTLWSQSKLIQVIEYLVIKQNTNYISNLSLHNFIEAKYFYLAIVDKEFTKFLRKSADWPAIVSLSRLNKIWNEFGKNKIVEGYTDIKLDEDGFILWMHGGNSSEDFIKVMVQTKKNFYAFVDTIKVFIWMVNLIVVGSSFLVYVFYARRISDLFFELETKNQDLEKANRSLEELSKLKSTFLAMISHELGTPLARITGNVNVIKKYINALPDNAKKKIDELFWEIEELKRLTKNALDLTRLQSDDLKARLILAQVDEFISNVVQKYIRFAKSKNIKLEISVQPTPPVYYDQYLLERCLDNLIINAIKYSNYNTTIKIYTTEFQNSVRINFENEGKPIPESERDKIFEKFYRLESNNDIPGTGLGLYLVRQFVWLMNGKVWVEPLENGNRFVLSLHG